MFDDGREMLEAMAQGAALSRGVLEEHHGLGARPRLERGANRFGNESQRLGIGTRGARPRMDDDAEKAERLGAVEFIGERLE